MYLSSTPFPCPAAERIVLIEGDSLLAELLQGAMIRRFGSARVEVLLTGAAGLEACLAAPPDVLICDVRLPDLDGREVVRRLRAAGHFTPVVVLTAHGDAALPGELVALGVAGYVDKGLPLEQVEKAVERVLAGGMYFHGVRVVPRPEPHAVRETPPDSRKLSALPPRQLEVLRLVSEGLSSKEIGDRLQLSPRTVEKIRVAMMETLSLPNTAALVRWAVRGGLDR